MLNSKHLATFLLGAAAGLAATKYMSMSDEEKEKMMADLKNKAKGFQDEAETMMEKAKDYFEELRTKGGETLKEHMADAETMVDELFNKKAKEEAKPEAGTPA
jgi:vacuolar-type H+-ATPase subunit H